MEKNDEDEFIRGSKSFRVLSSPLRGEYVKVCSSTGALLMLLGLVLSGKHVHHTGITPAKVHNTYKLCAPVQREEGICYLFFFRASRLTS